MRGFLVAMCITLFGLALPAHAQGMQAQCGEESGLGLTTDPELSETDEGWYSDRTSGGETVIRVDGDGEVEVRFKDARKIWLDVSDEGGIVELVSLYDAPPSFMVLVVYGSGVVETLSVSGFEGANATLIHTVSRNFSFLTSSRVMSADCLIAFY